MPERRQFHLILVAVLATVVLAASIVPGESAARPVVEPRAQRILTAAFGYLQAASEVSFHADITTDLSLPGQMIQFDEATDIDVRRPDGLRSSTVGAEGNVSKSWYDGKAISLWHRRHNLYAAAVAPPNLDDCIDTMRDNLGFAPTLASLLSSHLLERSLKGVTSGFYVALEPINGVLCHHLAFTQQKIDWQLWVEEGKQLTIRRISVVFKEKPGMPRYTAVFSRWDFKPGLVDFLFQFDPPEGAVKTDFLPASTP